MKRPHPLHVFLCVVLESARCAARAGEKVMCLDFHPVHNSLLAVGCHDGTVMVFDVRNKANRPIYSSSIKTGKHTDPVWQVGVCVYVCNTRTLCCCQKNNFSVHQYSYFVTSAP